MANAKIIEEKKAAVSALVEKLEKSNAVVLVDYRGINVADDTALRKELREANVEYKVIKNNLRAAFSLEFFCEQFGCSLCVSVNGCICDNNTLALNTV